MESLTLVSHTGLSFCRFEVPSLEWLRFDEVKQIARGSIKGMKESSSIGKSSPFMAQHFRSLRGRADESSWGPTFQVIVTYMIQFTYIDLCESKAM